MAKKNLYSVHMPYLMEELAKRGVHEYADIFPYETEGELERLSKNIQKNGLLERIKTHQGKIIDGRHRFMACKQAGVEPAYEEVNPDNLLEYVIGLNIHRRLMGTQERAWAASRVKESQSDLSRNHVAKMFKIGDRSLSSALAVRKNGTPKLKEAVQKGKIAVSSAEKISKLPSDDQDNIVQLPKHKRAEAIRKAGGAIKSKGDGFEQNKEIKVTFSQNELARIKYTLEKDNFETINELARQAILNYISNRFYMTEKQYRQMILEEVYENEPLKFVKKNYAESSLVTNPETGRSKQEDDYIREEDAWDDEFRGGDFENFLWAHGVDER